MIKDRSLALFIGVLCFLGEINSQTVNQYTHPELFKVNFEELNSVMINQLELQGQLYFIKEDYINAAKVFLQILKYNIDDPIVYYRLSCCYAMFNNPEYAGNFLVMAINAGFNNYDKIRNEKCFENIKSNNFFKKSLDEVLGYGERFGSTFYIEANVLLKSKLYMPENYDSTKKYNLLVGLHGYGGNAENFGLISHSIDSDDYIVVVPEAPYLKNEQSNRIAQYSWDFEVVDEELWKISDPAVMTYVMDVVDYMEKNYSIDRKYVLGFSQGAAYAYATGIRNADRIDGIIACGGRLPDFEKYPWFLSERELNDNSKVKICIIHGTNDKAIDHNISLKAKRTLKKYNYPVKMISFDGGHIVESNSLNEGLRWMEEKE